MRDLCQLTSNIRFQELIFLTDSNQISPSIGDCFYSKKVLGEYLVSLKRFLPLMEIETDIFDTITVDNLGQFSRELCKLDQITAP